MAALGAKSMQLLARGGVGNVSRRGLHVHQEGIPGATLPFKVGYEHRWKLLIGMTLYVGSAFSIPFLMVRHQLKKKSGA